MKAIALLLTAALANLSTALPATASPNPATADIITFRDGEHTFIGENRVSVSPLPFLKVSSSDILSLVSLSLPLVVSKPAALAEEAN
jgi:hypothetical protein